LEEPKRDSARRITDTISPLKAIHMTSLFLELNSKGMLDEELFPKKLNSLTDNLDEKSSKKFVSMKFKSRFFTFFCLFFLKVHKFTFLKIRFVFFGENLIVFYFEFEK
jgi:hypothetical protein